ncbi:unnamed protein product [Dibothriocephalus latus]|uniref:pyridoxal 5'-phosphate synthase n=1 Tax=Dibothriocephalus latus TaxID=60516 RepID=A0A3P7LSQ3_DIBLA|nr:unnamed protein product [Dibothriocephalus latus]
MRIPYRKETDRFTDFSLKYKNPFLQFKHWFEEALACPGLYEANAMALSTVSREGRPSSRYVLLKGLDERGFHFFTNTSSQKGKEMVVGVTLLMLALRKQIRMSACSFTGNRSNVRSLVDNKGFTTSNRCVFPLAFFDLLAFTPVNYSGRFNKKYLKDVRINGEATLLPDEEAVTYFSSRPKSSQVAAFVSDQSTPVPSDAHLLTEFHKAEKEFESTASVPKPKTWYALPLIKACIYSPHSQ